MVIRFGSEICSNLEVASRREWLVTNGRGGYACGTVAGVRTRTYHGLLVAALQPPLDQHLLVSALEETVGYAGGEYPLAVNRWRSGAVSPNGHLHLQHFALEGTVPCWHYACADALLVRQVWMPPGEQTTWVRYRLERGSAPVDLTIKVFLHCRSHHGGALPSLQLLPLVGGDGVQAVADGGLRFQVRLLRGTATLSAEVYRDVWLAAEAERGLNPLDDHLYAARLQRLHLQPGEECYVIATAEAEPGLDPGGSLESRRVWERARLWEWQQANPQLTGCPGWISQLVLAADQFIVERPLADGQVGKTVIAGYPWFSDWGRDTMISLPGLTLATGRPAVAAQILRTFDRFLDRGMIPNRFPDDNSTLDASFFNTADATLWYIEAVRACVEQTGDGVLLADLFPGLERIVHHHRQGTTHFHIRMDPDDGLLIADAPGVQLTWMDAIVDGRVITPRQGKPIEINALWYRALVTLAQLARLLGRDPAEYRDLADRVRTSFLRFWNPAVDYCYDVLDGPDGHDPALRPNQLFAVTLGDDLLPEVCRRRIVTVIGAHLLTTCGLRSLAPGVAEYQGHYGGSPYSRDAAYHQGTAWAWLLGVYARAHLMVHDQPRQAASLLEPIADHLHAAGLGTISEIFDGDPPFAARGCIAQAWSVATVLDAWLAIQARLGAGGFSGR